MLRTLVLAIHTYIYMCSKDDVFQTVSLFFLVVLSHTQNTRTRSEWVKYLRERERERERGGSMFH